MSQNLEQITRHLRDARTKAQLIYALIGTGKSQIAHAFMERVATGPTARTNAGPTQRKVLCCTAATKDLPLKISTRKKQFEDRGDCPLLIRRAI